MKNLDFTIELEDLQILFVKTRHAYKNMSFEKWTEEAKKSYSEYHERNSNDLKKYGQPKTFFQWVNGQIIALN